MQPRGFTQVTSLAERSFESKADSDVRWWRERNQRFLEEGAYRVSMAECLDIPTYFGILHLKAPLDGRMCDLGVVSLRVVTYNGTAAIVDSINTTSTLAGFVYHGLGTGKTVIPAANQTTLETEFTTQYDTDPVDQLRPSGSITNPTALSWSTSATVTVNTPATVTEHGVFDDAEPGLGTMLDRSLFAEVTADVGLPVNARFDLVFYPGG